MLGDAVFRSPMLRTVVKMANTRRMSIDAMRYMAIHQNSFTLKQSRPIQGNIVRLCGQITEQPPKVSNQGAAFAMKTVNAQDGSNAKHVIFSSSAIIKSLPVDQLNKGHRVYVVGSVGYRESQSAEGLSNLQPLIISHNIFPCSSNNDGPSKDVNEVRMFGTIKRKTRIQDYATCLEIATTYFAKKEQQYKDHLHQVIVMDDDKIRNQANSVSIGSSVFVHGSLQSEAVKDENGHFSQHIRATQLVTVCGSSESFLDLDMY